LGHDPPSKPALEWDGAFWIQNAARRGGGTGAHNRVGKLRRESASRKNCFSLALTGAEMQPGAMAPPENSS
jgi:hypothetical protein